MPKLYTEYVEELKQALDCDDLETAMVHAKHISTSAMISANTAAAPSPAAAPAPTPPSLGAPGSLGNRSIFRIPLHEANDRIILFTHGPSILSDEPYDIIEELVTCPLYIFKYGHLIAKLKDRIDSSMMLVAYTSDITVSPESGRPVWNGGICLGTSESHCVASSVAFDRIFGGQGNQDLWFAVIWLLVENLELPQLNVSAHACRRHMSWRVFHHFAPLTLIEKPLERVLRVPLGIAVWHTLAASALEPEPSNEALRDHITHATQLLQIVGLTGFPLPPELYDHISRLRILFHMYDWMHKEPTQLPELMQEFIEGRAAGSIERMGRVYESLPPFYRELDPQSLVELSRHVDLDSPKKELELSFFFLKV
jgi:hypothetical protein